MPGGSLSPWNEGLWPSLGRAAITKNMSWFARISYEQKHAHPARVAKTATGSSQEERLDILKGIIAWGLNAAFALPQGWELDLVESNGRGIDIYEHSIDTCNKDMATSLCGSTVMFEGGKGFSGTDVFRIVQSDLIKGTADAICHTINTQGLPAFIAQRWGVEALNDATTVEYDTTEPKDREAETRIMTGLGSAVSALSEALRGSGQALDIAELMSRFGIPLVEDLEQRLDQSQHEVGKLEAGTE
ncbi:MAG: phage portal protein family protein [Polyangiaceae bacterium]